MYDNVPASVSYWCDAFLLENPDSAGIRSHYQHYGVDCARGLSWKEGRNALQRALAPSSKNLADSTLSSCLSCIRSSVQLCLTNERHATSCDSQYIYSRNINYIIFYIRPIKYEGSKRSKAKIRNLHRFCLPGYRIYFILIYWDMWSKLKYLNLILIFVIFVLIEQLGYICLYLISINFISFQF